MRHSQGFSPLPGTEPGAYIRSHQGTLTPASAEAPVPPPLANVVPPVAQLFAGTSVPQTAHDYVWRVERGH